MRVYDDFPMAAGSPELQSGGFGVSRLRFWLLPAPSASGRTMRANQRRCLCLGISILGMLMVSSALMGQAVRQASPKSETALPVLSDWSQHHLIFSKPATAEQAKVLEREPRYQQQLRRQLSARLPEAEIGALPPELKSPGQMSHMGVSRRIRNRGAGGLWSEDMGSGATVGAVNYPAKARSGPIWSAVPTIS